MRIRSALRVFEAQLHATLALELAQLIADDVAFERMWRRPRWQGLKLGTRTLAQASAAAARALRRSRASPTPRASTGSDRRAW